VYPGMAAITHGIPKNLVLCEVREQRRTHLNNQRHEAKRTARSPEQQYRHAKYEYG